MRFSANGAVEMHGSYRPDLKSQVQESECLGSLLINEVQTRIFASQSWCDDGRWDANMPTLEYLATKFYQQGTSPAFSGGQAQQSTSRASASMTKQRASAAAQSPKEVRRGAVNHPRIRSLIHSLAIAAAACDISFSCAHWP